MFRRAAPLRSTRPMRCASNRRLPAGNPFLDSLFQMSRATAHQVGLSFVSDDSLDLSFPRAQNEIVSTSTLRSNSMSCADYSPLRRRSRPPPPRPRAATSPASGDLEFVALVPEDYRAQSRVVVWRIGSVVRPLLVGNDEGVSDAAPYLHVTHLDPELRALAVTLPHGLVEHAGVNDQPLGMMPRKSDER